MSTTIGRVVVVGAGPAGCISACMLARRGFEVVVYERQSELQIMGKVGNDRTFIMSLSSRSVGQQSSSLLHANRLRSPLSLHASQAPSRFLSPSLSVPGAWLYIRTTLFFTNTSFPYILSRSMHATGLLLKADIPCLGAEAVRFKGGYAGEWS